MDTNENPSYHIDLNINQSKDFGGHLKETLDALVHYAKSPSNGRVDVPYSAMAPLIQIMELNDAFKFIEEVDFPVFRSDSDGEPSIYLFPSLEDPGDKLRPLGVVRLKNGNLSAIKEALRDYLRSKLPTILSTTLSITITRASDADVYSILVGDMGLKIGIFGKDDLLMDRLAFVLHLV